MRLRTSQGANAPMTAPTRNRVTGRAAASHSNSAIRNRMRSDLRRKASIARDQSAGLSGTAIAASLWEVAGAMRPQDAEGVVAGDGDASAGSAPGGVTPRGTL